MMEKSKRGNGSTLMYVILRRDSFLSRPYMNYLSHITKVNNIRPSRGNSAREMLMM